MSRGKSQKKAADNDGLNLVEIMTRFSTDDEARAFLESIRWPEGPVCPHCGNFDRATIYDIAANADAEVRAGLRECKACGAQFTVTVGTIFESSKVPLRKWVIAWFLLCSSKKGISALQIQRMLGIGSYRTAWFMMHRIRYALRDPVFADKLGENGGIVEADETYVGGKVRGKGRAYKGNKTPVVALVERGGRVRSRTVKKVTGATLKQVLSDHVDPSANLMTDDLAAYRKPGKNFASHEAVNHSAGEYARGNAHTNTVEGYFSLLKRGVIGTFHHISEKHMDQYLAEFDFRYTHRDATDGARTVSGLKKVAGKRLMLRRPNGKA
jgi:transposase-like protein